jgi:hypothetical protein
LRRVFVLLPGLVGTEGTGWAACVELFPLTAPTPGAEALVIWIIPCEMAMMGESLLVMAADHVRDPFIVAHTGGRRRRYGKEPMKCCRRKIQVYLKPGENGLSSCPRVSGDI